MRVTEKQEIETGMRETGIETDVAEMTEVKGEEMIEGVKDSKLIEGLWMVKKEEIDIKMKNGEINMNTKMKQMMIKSPDMEDISMKRKAKRNTNTVLGLVREKEIKI